MLVFKVGGFWVFVVKDFFIFFFIDGVWNVVIVFFGSGGGRWGWFYRLEFIFGFYEKEVLWENWRF